MKKILSIILTLTLSATVFAQPLPKKLEHNEKMAWWRNAKFGMFVHWGPYCLYGGVYNGFNQRRGGAEWIMNRCKIPVREYRAKACTFNPVDFNAEELVIDGVPVVCLDGARLGQAVPALEGQDSLAGLRTEERVDGEGRQGVDKIA